MRSVLAGLCLLLMALPAVAQDVTPKGYKPPPLGKVTEATPARDLFGRVAAPAKLPPKVIGGYAKGCVAGAAALPTDGDAWQVMRLSRHRNFGHPDLIAFLERLARTVPTVSSWRGLLIGDMSQPRGGPMLTGHASHQIGLDADIWLTPKPAAPLSVDQRETMSATNVVADSLQDVDPARWTPDHLAVIRQAAIDPAVHRIFVNPAIKKAICREAKGDRGWLSKVRPMWGHNYHFHVRLGCPAGQSSCENQKEPPDGDGCGKELDDWLALMLKKPTKPSKPKPPLLMSDLPAECRKVLAAP